MSEELSKPARPPRWGLVCWLLASVACGSSGSPTDAGATHDAARADANADNPLREDLCAYWPLDPGPSCGEVLYGSVDACLVAIAGCEDAELLGVGFCWEGADERCSRSCLPDCADPP
jgi:hypothetical protein